MKFHADFLEDAIGIRLDQAKALLVEDVEGPDAALDIGALRRPRGALDAAAGPSARPGPCIRVGGPVAFLHPRRSLSLGRITVSRIGAPL